MPARLPLLVLPIAAAALLLAVWAPIVLYAAAAAGCATRAVRSERDRAAWTMIAVGIASFGIGSLISDPAGPQRSGDTVPFAAPVLWLSFSALVYVALGLMLCARLRLFHLTFWFDGLIGALTIAASTTFVVRVLDLRPATSTLDLVIELAFPTADILLAAVALWGLVATGWRRGRTWAFLTAALALLSTADLLLVLDAGGEIAISRPLVGAVLPLAMLLIAAAADQAMPRSRTPHMHSPLGLAMPMVCMLICVGLLAVADPIGLSAAGHTLALIVLCLGVVRALVTLRELASLTESRRFERGFREAAIGMALVSLDLRPLRVNQTLCRLLGRTSDTLTARSLRDVVHPDDRDRLDALGDRGSGGTAAVELRMLHASGAVIDAVLTTAAVGDEGAERELFAQIEDVTARRRAERQTAAAAELGRRAIQITDVASLMRDSVGVVAGTLGTPACFVGRWSAPDAFTMVTTTDPAVDGATLRLDGSTTVDEVRRTGAAVLSNDIERDPRLEVHPLARDRDLMRVIGVPIPRRADRSFVLVVHRTAADRPFTPEDVRFVEAVANVLATALDRAEADAATRHQALHDPLTGLANRTFLSGQVEQALAAAHRDHGTVALLLLDVDRFKLVNDTIGHSAGDAVLCEVADRLRALVRGGDVAARLGGDEFVVACSGVAHERDVASLAERIVRAFQEPFSAGGREWHLAASVGVALGGAGVTADELLRDADLAMYRAKDGGGDRYEIFDGAMRARVFERLGLEAALRAAVDRGELTLHYQPLVDLAGGGLEGFEALVRWEHPERGLVGPDAFIPIAEDTDLILPIGHWVLQSACTQIAAWNAAWPDRAPVHVRVNLSPRQITPALPAAVATAIRETGIEAAQLGLEITERLLVEEPTASAILEEVRDLGVSVALDDFGTGYSSLSFLKSYPVDVLKLDRSLIAELGRSPETTAIVKAAVDMAAALGLRVVGEGIEEEAQAHELRMLGCELGQGFLFARPLVLRDAEALLAAPSPFAVAAAG